MPSVLFVCTANVCRSPMARAIFQQLVDQSESGLSWKIESAGTWAVDGKPASAGSVQVMREQGLDIQSHVARTISEELISSFDLVLTMEIGHKEAIRAEFPAYAERIYILSEMAGYSHDIQDPFGGPISAYEQTAREITHLLEQGFERIKAIATSGQQE